MPFANYIGGHKRLWTREYTISGLQLAASQIKGILPCCDLDYNRLKKGHLEWPTAMRVLEYFGSMAGGWIAAGASAKRVRFNNIDWSPEDELYLEERAGIDTLGQIGRHLGRSAAACKRRLYMKGITARGNQGFFSASELAKEYDCPCHRIRCYLSAGVIPGKFDKYRNRWQVNPFKITPDIAKLLAEPKRTHKKSATDKGDYMQRYGIRRRIINGKLTRVEVAE